MEEYNPRINISENNNEFMYCTSCGCSEKIRKIYDLTFDNMKIRICSACVDHLYKGLTAMRKGK